MIRRRRMGLALLAVLGLVVVLAGAAKLYFTPERLRGLLLPRLEETVGGKVAVESLSLDLWPPLGVRVLGITVWPDPEGEEPPVLQARAITFRMRLLPLLARQVLLSGLVMDGPGVYLERGLEGLNIAGRLERFRERPKRYGFAVTSARISEGRFTYRDLVEDRTLSVLGLEQRLGLEVEDDELILRGRVRIDTLRVDRPQGQVAFGPLGLDHRLAVNPKTERMELRAVQVELAGLEFTVGGTITGLKPPLGLDLQVEGRDISLARAIAAAGQWAPGILGWVEADGMLDVNATVARPREEGAATEVESKVRLRNVRVSGPAFAVPVIELDGSLRLAVGRAGEQLQLDEVQVGVSGLKLKIGGTVTGLKPPYGLDLKVEGRDLPLAQAIAVAGDRVPASLASMEWRGGADLDMAIQRAAEEEAKPQLDLTARLRQVGLAGGPLPLPLSQVDGTIRYRLPVLRLEEVRGQWGGHPMALAGTVTLGEPPTFDLTVKADLDLTDVKGLSEKASSLAAGRVSLDLRTRGRRDSLSAVRLDGSVGLREVQIARDGPDITGLTGAFKLRGQEATFERLDLRIGGSDLHLTQGRLVGPLPPAGAFRLRASRLDLDELTGAKSDSDGAGPREGGPPVLLPVSKLDVDLTVGELVTKGVVLRDVRGRLTADPSEFTWTNLEANLLGGRIATAGQAGLAPGSPYRISFRGTEMRADRLGSLFPKLPARFQGLLDLESHWEGSDLRAGLKERLSGQGSLRVTDGMVVQSPLSAGIVRWLGRGDLDSLRLAETRLPFTMDHGRLTLPTMSLTRRKARLTLAGNAALGGGLDLRLTVLLPREWLSGIQVVPPELITLVADEEGRVPLDLVIGGTFESPEVILDRERIGDRLRRRAEEGFRGLFRRLLEPGEKAGPDTTKGSGRPE